MKDYFKILGVRRTASGAEIKLAFREELKKCHPDLFPNDPKAAKRYAEIVEAYKVIGNLESRLKYHAYKNRADVRSIVGHEKRKKRK